MGGGHSTIDEQDLPDYEIGSLRCTEVGYPDKTNWLTYPRQWNPADKRIVEGLIFKVVSHKISPNECGRNAFDIDTAGAAGRQCNLSIQLVANCNQPLINRMLLRSHTHIRCMRSPREAS